MKRVILLLLCCFCSSLLHADALYSQPSGGPPPDPSPTYPRQGQTSTNGCANISGYPCINGSSFQMMGTGWFDIADLTVARGGSYSAIAFFNLSSTGSGAASIMGTTLYNVTQNQYGFPSNVQRFSNGIQSQASTYQVADQQPLSFAAVGNRATYFTIPPGGGTYNTAQIIVVHYACMTYNTGDVVNISISCNGRSDNGTCNVGYNIPNVPLSSITLIPCN